MFTRPGISRSSPLHGHLLGISLIFVSQVVQGRRAEYEGRGFLQVAVGPLGWLLHGRRL